MSPIFEVNVNVHKVVVVLDEKAYGFTALYSAILFIEEISKGEDVSKLFNAITIALGDDKADGKFQIYDIETFADLFMDDDEDDE